MDMDKPKIAEHSLPIAENEHVKELLKIILEHNAPTMKDMLSVLGQIGAMEKQLEAAVTELSAMRRELAEAQAQNHPAKTIMQKAVITMQGQVLELRDKLAEIKQNIIDGCKNAIAAFKEKGISALDDIARFFKIRPMLESIRSEIDKGIKIDDKAIAKIENISKEYHEAGRHLKNISRVIMGKEPIRESKPIGAVAKSFTASFRAERKCLCVMKNNIEAAIGSFSRLEERASKHKPSIQKDLQKFNSQISQARKDSPTLERPQPANAER